MRLIKPHKNNGEIYKGANPIIPTTVDIYVKKDTYLDKDLFIKGEPNLTPQNILYGKKFFNVYGTAKPKGKFENFFDDNAVYEYPICSVSEMIGDDFIQFTHGTEDVHYNYRPSLIVLYNDPNNSYSNGFLCETIAVNDFTPTYKAIGSDGSQASYGFSNLEFKYINDGNTSTIQITKNPDGLRLCPKYFIFEVL